MPASIPNHSTTDHSTTDHSDPHRLSSRDRGVITILLIATFVVILNETIMNVALPRLMVDLGVSASTVQWLATAFLLTMAVVIPATGFILQRFSTRTVFVTAMGLFSLGTLIAGSAPGFPVLLVGRIVQASGTALMLPLLTTTILALVKPERRGAMIGMVSIVISVAPAVGPTLSGLILEALPWRYLFLFVLPVALATMLFGAWRLVNVGETRRTSLDLASVILSALGFGGIVYGLSSAGGEPEGWSTPQVVVALAVGSGGLLLFIWRQFRLQRRDAPLLDLRAFRYPMFALSTLLIMIVMMALFGAAILLPIYLQSVRGFGALQTGLLLLPGGVLMGVMAPPVGRLFDRYGPTLLASTGAALLTFTLWRFSTLSAITSVGMLLALHLTFSLGLALLFTPILTSGLNPLPSRLYAHGSAIMSTLQQVAGAVGTALLVTIMTTRTAARLQSVSPQLAQSAGLQAAFAAAAGVAAVALVLALFLRRTLPDENDTGTQAGTGADADTEPQPALSAH